MATEEEQQPVADAIKSLPMRLRKPFVMAHLQHMPRAEIAAELHMSEHRVDRRLTRALIAYQDTVEGRVPVWLTAIRLIATPFVLPLVLPLVLSIHVAYVIMVRVCALLGLQPPRPWIR